MAESFLFSVAENILGKIASLALQEVSLAWGLKRDLNKLEENLTIIKAVLLDAEEKQAQNHALRVWLGKLKNFCYDAEDVLDELEYEGLRKQLLKQYGNTKIKVRRFFSSSNPLVFSFKMGHKLKELRERLDEIAAGQSKFHLIELVDYRLAGRIRREMTDSLLHTSNVIGRESDKEILVNNFLLDPIGGGHISVIPIVGIGGLGKTTVAKLLYNDQRVDNHFDLKIWVCVSESFEKKQIMVSVLKSLTHQNRGDLDPDQLQKLIQEKLNSKKFLLVLDDVWSDDRGKWIEFRDLLEGGAAGSKVIVTTRNASVATTVGNVPSYDLAGLSHEQCLSLFKKLAFREGEEDLHPHLEKMGGDIVRKCGGLPLAVKTLGTLLYAKSDERYWKFIRDNEIWKLPQEENYILPALKLSYDQMPSHLKSCFGIFSLFPKGYDFRSVDLVQYWMANGLLQSSNEHQSIEDVAFQYMKELYWRSFLQDFEDYGLYFTFKMHDLVHDLALSVAQNEYSVVNTPNKNISDEVRHLRLSGKALLEQEIPGFLRKKNKLRTIIFPSKLQGPVCESFVNTCISTCSYLRTMELRGSFFEVLPTSIGDLKHLRYLDVDANSRARRLPDSFWKLHNLETLLLVGCSELDELPRGIRNLIKLRVLRVTVKQKYLPEDEIGCLTSLQVLSIATCTNLEILFEGMQRLTSLRFMQIWKRKNLTSLPRNLKYLTGLEVLVIKNCDQLNLVEEDENQDIKVSLQSLGLESLPLLVTLPQWLKKSFNTLQNLIIDGCENFSTFPEWFQDFPSLKKILIQDCPKLLSLPEGMHHLTALKELKIYGCPMLSKRCKMLVGEDWHKIAHVSKIDIDDDNEDDDHDEDDDEDEDEALSTA
ncbi:putative disease resistance protein RGA1 [Tripterygium wilfordii]|uniref:putative disease resistance protein RGA1 n=1 Tax=Tripterygium wilfordii TaxID=458696 RepID=UPI0018F81C9E|nr:putative disease resistance protein RGA1 [Tripterygium wilfordii]XP_038691558.1 putative disease resistance protein RGA1 [Tripterygium wilfordii]XP_038691559.1 putative disease resistance protein RGA1 [Tripterygium wilfordii]XP_038691560.1 putative disease resistance protein RGA1 [Tripterygium wilfordii]XP_038691561.1 putative disease resistance protein RGA1 [Tripterygium wilfordii]XP_038691562.1 putative disease resistance protein RGA1 [Tripterygium wilfordii]XP_038691563.1 putative disea